MAMCITTDLLHFELETAFLLPNRYTALLGNTSTVVDSGSRLKEEIIKKLFCYQLTRV